jgi:hypothetical protein
MPSNTSEGSHLARNNIKIADDCILGHCKPNREIKPKSFMISNNSRLSEGKKRVLQEIPHNKNYKPIFFIPVIGPPRQEQEIVNNSNIMMNELPQIEEQKEPIIANFKPINV